MIQGIQTTLGSQYENQDKSVIGKQTMTQPEVKDGKKKLALALGALGIAGAVGISIAMKIKQGKNFKAEISTIEAKLKNIEFDKGIAKLKETGENFSGQIRDKLKNGDEIILSYEDGKIFHAIRNGQKNCFKAFSKNGKINSSVKGKTIRRIFTKTDTGHKILILNADGSAVTKVFDELTNTVQKNSYKEVTNRIYHELMTQFK